MNGNGIDECEGKKGKKKREKIPRIALGYEEERGREGIRWMLLVIGGTEDEKDWCEKKSERSPQKPVI